MILKFQLFENSRYGDELKSIFLVKLKPNIKNKSKWYYKDKYKNKIFKVYELKNEDIFKNSYRYNDSLFIDKDDVEIIKIIKEHFDEFFTDVSTGKRGTSDIEYKNFYDVQDEEKNKYLKSFKKHNIGKFGEHISKSIPGYKEVQIKTAKGVVEMLKKKGYTANVLDIGGSDNTWSKTITEVSNNRIYTTTLDPNEEMKKVSDENKVDRNEYHTKSFMTPYKNVQKMNEKKFDVVHESMTLQFISNQRNKQIKYIKDNLLKKGGLFITEEKLYNSLWDENEELKNKYKQIYFEDKELKQKSKEILKGGMNKNLIKKEELEKTLKNNFEYYYLYWDGGNFFGYVASDKKIKIEKFKLLVSIPSFRTQIQKFFNKNN